MAGERSRHPRPLGAVWHQPVAQASASWYVREERCLTPVRFGTGRRGHPVQPTTPRGSLIPTTRSGVRRAPQRTGDQRNVRSSSSRLTPLDHARV